MYLGGEGALPVPAGRDHRGGRELGLRREAGKAQKSGARSLPGRLSVSWLLLEERRRGAEEEEVFIRCRLLSFFL